MDEPISDIVRRCVEVALDPTSTTVGDVSLCLPEWLTTFDKAYRENGPVNLSPNAAACLYHTLLAAKDRAARLVKERDEARKALNDYKNQPEEVPLPY